MLQLAAVLFLAQTAPMTLQDCVREGLRRHPSLQLSQAGIESARAQKLGTRAGYLPRLDLSIRDSYTYSGRQEGQRMVIGGQVVPIPGREAGGNDYHVFSLSLSQNLYDGGKWWTAVERADREIERAQASYGATREEVALGVAAAFYQMQKVARELAVWESAVEVSRGQLRLAEEKLALGAASKVDVAMARRALGEDEVALERARLSLEAARQELNMAMGREAMAELVLAPDDEAQAEEELPAEVRPDHPRLREVDLARRVAEKDTAIARGDRWPRVQGSLSYSRGNEEFYKVYSRFDQLFDLTVGLSISFPVFDGFLTRAQIEQAEARERRVDAERRQIEADLSGRLAAARERARRLAEVARLQAENVKAAEAELSLALERFQVGEGTELEVRNSQLNVTRARLSELETLFERKGVRVQYLYARGELLSRLAPGNDKEAP